MVTRARILMVAVGVATLAMTASCSLSGRATPELPRSTSRPSASAEASAQPSATASSPTATPGSGEASETASAVSQCVSENMRVKMVALAPSMGTEKHQITVANTQSEPCLLPPAPWVLLQDQSGHSISQGVPLGTGASIELAPGAEAAATITIMPADTLGERCSRAAVRTLVVGLQVNDRRAQMVPVDNVACRNLPTAQPGPFTLVES